ncbi:MAG: hypothetical protein HYV09_02680 [Deltaproteobacteria bacterium]|nr:hypothetical protein [Deltaproteobacteria bacterium]
MSSLRDALRAGEKLPVEIETLVDFAAAHDGALAGDLELVDDGASAMLAWFSDRAEPASQFFAFGRDGTGALFAIWRRGDTLSDSPVVFLGNEGETIVLAGTPREFLGLLAYGVEDLGFTDWEEEPPQPEGDARAVALRAFLREKLGVEMLPRPADVVLRAREEHPDLESFVLKAIA